MILLANPEIWLVCGSQHLYGPGPLKQVAANARADRRRPRQVEGAAAEDGVQGAADDARRDRQAVPRGEFRSQLRRPDPLDAHLLAVEDVDPRPQRPAEAVRAPAHAVQRRAAVGHDRHGLHEPQPGRRTATARPASSTRACAWRARSWSATGPIRRCTIASARGCARRAPGTTGRARSSAASATTCARWRSPRATRSAPR